MRSSAEGPLLTARPMTTRWISGVSAMRFTHWVKNILLFVPLFLAHQVTDLERLLSAVVAFLSFGLVASAGYVVNDLVDQEADRLHARKRNRPFADGRLSTPEGIVLAATSAGAGLSLALVALSPLFVLEISCYLLAALAYTFWVKRYPVADVLFLAGFYTIRLIAGATAVSVPLSPWAASFAMFLFLSLAFVKRHSELAARGSDGIVPARGYRPDDRSVLETLGPASGYLSVLVLALYINSDAVTELYRRPYILWLTLPILLYWITRLWFRAHRGVISDDPLVETAGDPVSYLALAAAVAVVLAAI